MLRLQKNEHDLAIFMTLICEISFTHHNQATLFWHIVCQQYVASSKRSPAGCVYFLNVVAKRGQMTEYLHVFEAALQKKDANVLKTVSDIHTNPGKDPSWSGTTMKSPIMRLWRNAKSVF